MIEVFWDALKNMESADDGAVQAAAERIKALPRTKEGLFEMADVDANVYKAGKLVYPVYTRYETLWNKKEGYPDLMEQLRVLSSRVEGEFTQENVVDFLVMMLATIGEISPQIYENYRELVDIFRDKFHKMMVEFGLDQEKPFAGFADSKTAKTMGKAMESAFAQDVLLREKYAALAKAMEQ